jgi:GntP family gluconate:H+ symporter
MMNPHSISLLLTAAAAILILIILIAKVKLHPFLALLLVSIGLGIIAGMPLANVVRSFEGGVGTTLGHVAVVIALGTMLGKMMADSGGADRIAETLIGVFGIKHIQWAMLLIGIIPGLPVFFEVGFVLLIPIAFTVARRSGVSLLLVALPMLAGLSVVHAFIHLIPPRWLQWSFTTQTLARRSALRCSSVSQPPYWPGRCSASTSQKRSSYLLTTSSQNNLYRR